MDAKTIISLIASVNTIISMRMAGRNDHRFNYLGLVNCVVWTAFTVLTASWGLMLLNGALAYTYTQNLRIRRKNVAV